MASVSSLSSLLSSSLNDEEGEREVGGRCLPAHHKTTHTGPSHSSSCAHCELCEGLTLLAVQQAKTTRKLHAQVEVMRSEMTSLRRMVEEKEVRKTREVQQGEVGHSSDSDDEPHTKRGTLLPQKVGSSSSSGDEASSPAFDTAAIALAVQSECAALWREVKASTEAVAALSQQQSREAEREKHSQHCASLSVEVASWMTDLESRTPRKSEMTELRGRIEALETLFFQSR